MMKKLFLLLVGIAMAGLSGCSARAHELEGSAIVKALAFDKAQKGYEVTAYITGAENENVITVTAENPAEGMYRLNAVTERKIFLGKNQVILISSEIRNIEEILLTLYSSQEARTAAKLLIVQGTAKEALSYRGLYQETATDIEKTIENAAENSNYPVVTLFGGVNSMAAEVGCCVLPVAKMEEENLSIEQCAVYREYQILQTLSQEQILGCALLRGDDSAYFSLGDGGYSLREISAKISEENNRNLIQIECTCRLLAGSSEKRQRAEIENRLYAAVREAYDLAQKLNANFLDLYPCDLSLPADIIVNADPAANDYPQKGVNP